MDINQVLKDASKEIELAKTQADLQNLKVSYLGKKGKITELLKSLKDLSLEEKKTVGAQINFLRDNVDSLIKEKLLEITDNLSSYEELMKNYPFESTRMCEEYLNSMFELVTKKRENYNYKNLKSNKFKYLLVKFFKSEI